MNTDVTSSRSIVKSEITVSMHINAENLETAQLAKRAETSLVLSEVDDSCKIHEVGNNLIPEEFDRSCCYSVNEEFSSRELLASSVLATTHAIFAWML